MPRDDGVPPGTLIMLILRVLASEPLHGYAIAQFLAVFPKGFLDPAYVGNGEGAKGERASRWRAAHDAWVKHLGGGEGEKLLESNRTEEAMLRNEILQLKRQRRQVAEGLRATLEMYQRMIDQDLKDGPASDQGG